MSSSYGIISVPGYAGVINSPISNIGVFTLGHLSVIVEEGNIKHYEYERLDKYVVEIECVGLEENEIDINFGNGIIRIRSNPTDCTECSVEDYDVIGQAFEKNKFRCKICCENIDSVKSYLKNGLLTIDIFKLIKSQKIDIISM